MGGVNGTQNNSPLPSTAGSGAKGFASSTWDAQLGWHERFVLWVLRQGVIPRHVAFVPDGSRRFAKTNGLTLSHAYSIMLRKIAMIWSYMGALGVTEVTAFLMSTRNFSRNTPDVTSALDELAKFFINILHSLKILRQMNLRVSVVGNMHLLPIDMQADTAQIDIATHDSNRRNTLRLCTAYNSKVGLKNMALDFANAVRRDVIKSDDISPSLIAGWLAIMEAPETELWFRSSGEVRFSEFLVLQSGYSYIHIDPKHWIELRFWNFVWTILQYQINWPHIKAVKDKHRALCASHRDWNDTGKIIRQRSFLEQVKSTRVKQMHILCSGKTASPVNNHN